MKKYYYILIIVLLLNSCNEIKIPVENFSNTRSNKQGFWLTDWNGYDEKTECIASYHIMGGHFHKILFKNSSREYFVTKYAYCTYIEYNKRVKRRVLWFCVNSNTDNYLLYRAIYMFLFPIRIREKSCLFANYCDMNAIDSRMSKIEYCLWMFYHPETKILDA